MPTPETGYPWTNIAAWWGAVLATLVLIWDVFKWLHSGARISLKALPNMISVPENPLLPGEKVFVEVSNSGVTPTTLKGIGILYYESWWKRILRRPKEQGVIAQPNPQFPLPHTLEAGKIWQGFINQDEIEDKLISGVLYVWCDCSHSKRMIDVRVKKRKPKKDSEAQ